MSHLGHCDECGEVQFISDEDHFCIACEAAAEEFSEAFRKALKQGTPPEMAYDGAIAASKGVFAMVRGRVSITNPATFSQMGEKL